MLTLRKTSLAALLTVAVLTSTGAGCPQARFAPGTTLGLIHVDRAEIYTRERLVNDRLEQERWLRAQLARTDQLAFGIDGVSDLRSFMGLSSSTELQYSPLAMELRRTQLQSEIAGLGRTEQLQRLEQEKQLLQLQQEIAALRGNGSMMAAAEADGNENGDNGNGNGDKDDAAGNGDANGGDGNGADASAGSGSDLTGTAPPTLTNRIDTIVANFDKYFADPGDATISGLKSSPIDTFRDRLAYREEVRNALIENSLDDAHDLRGNTLYRLKFDTTVVPDGRDASALAYVNVTLGPPAWLDGIDCTSPPARIATLFDSWLDEIEAFAESEVERIYYWPTEEESAAVNRLARVALSQAGLAPLDVLDENLRRLEGLEPDIEVELDQDQEDAVRLREEGLIRAYLRGEFERLQMAKYLEPPREDAPNEPFQKLAALDELSRSAAPIVEFCRVLETRSTTYAYAVTPKESAQRLSDVASRRESTELSLALGALTGGLGIENLTQYTAASEALFQAIRRQPMVVGYSHNATYGDGDQNTFGWILGPRYQINDDGTEVGFRHRVVQESLAAVVSLPAWWDATTVRVTRGWLLEPDSDAGDGHTVLVDDTGPRRVPITSAPGVENVAEYEISLPSDPSSIARVFDGLGRKPTVSDHTPAELEIGKPARIMIFGKDLWRSPVVSLDGQVAEAVGVLPDMNGLIATFNEVAQPAGWQANATSGDVDLWVFTSEGRTNVGIVTLHKPARPTPVRMVPTYAATRVVAGLPATITVPRGSIPSAYQYLRIGVRRQAAAGPFATRDFDSINATTGELLFSVPHDWLKAAIGETVAIDGAPLQLAVMLSRRPDAQPEVYTSTARPVYFTSATAAGGTVAAVGSVDNLPFDATYSLPVEFAAAYPAFDEAKVGATASIDGVADTTVKLRVEKGKRTGRQIPLRVVVESGQSAWENLHAAARKVIIVVNSGDPVLGTARAEITVPKK